MNDGRIGLLQACDDPELLNFKPWPRQRELLAAIDEGPRIHILALGRRSGKTLLMAIAALHNLLLRPDLDGMVRAGEPRFALCIGSNISQARLLLRAALSIVRGSPVLAGLLESSTEHELRFEGGRVLAALPCTSRGARGWSVSFLALDEFGHFVSDSEGPAAAARVWEALTPSLAQFGDEGRIIVSSTPAGDGNEFARLFHLADEGAMPGAAAHHATTREMTPTTAISDEFLAGEEARDPVSFASEYLAAFSGGRGAFFDDDLLAACVGRDDELDPSEATDWTAGLDPGIWRDPFAVALVGRSLDDSSRLMLGCVRAWQPPKQKPGFELERRALEARVLGEVGDVLARYGVSRAITDGFMGAAVDEALRARGIWPEKITLSGPMRLEVFASLRSAMQGGRLTLYRHDGLLAELARVRTSYKSGQLQVETPRSASGHFDLAISLSLAVHALDRGGPVGNGQPFLVHVDEPSGPLYGLFGEVGSARRRPQSNDDWMKRVF